MGVAGTDQAGRPSSGCGLKLVGHGVQCQSVCGVILVASVHIMSVSRQGVAKMRNRRGSRIYQPIDVFTIVHFLRRYTLIHLRIHIDTSSYLNKAPRHDDASTLHNLMALGPVAPAQRAARREPGSGVWCRLITCSFDGGLSSDRTPQCGAALSIPHTPHTSPPHNEGRPGLPRPSQTPEKRTARQEPRTRSTDHSF